MKKIYLIAAMLIMSSLVLQLSVFAQAKPLTLVFIRHGERPDDGENLNCQGLNRSMLLPALLNKKFGRPANIYIPALNEGKTTKRTRMLQTITPFAVKYDLSINSKYEEEDADGIAASLLKETGTVIIVWEHNTIQPVLKKLGVKKTGSLDWPGKDFDSMWIVTFPGGKATLTQDKEGLNPPAACPF